MINQLHNLKHSIFAPFQELELDEVTNIIDSKRFNFRTIEIDGKNSVNFRKSFPKWCELVKHVSVNRYLVYKECKLPLGLTIGQVTLWILNARHLNLLTRSIN